VVLRLYEASGGHAKAHVKIASHIKVVKATITNLLEEDIETLEILRSAHDEEKETKLGLRFRGFQVITVKLILENEKEIAAPRRSHDSWVEVPKQ